MLSTLNEKQSKAITDSSKRLLISAGAGSGKTKTLTQKIEYLVKHQNVNAHEILGITFTKNAAHEMVDRLIINNDLEGEYENLLYTCTDDEIEKHRKDYKSEIGWLNNLKIVTFHSLCY